MDQSSFLLSDQSSFFVGRMGDGNGTYTRTATAWWLRAKAGETRLFKQTPSAPNGSRFFFMIKVARVCLSGEVAKKQNRTEWERALRSKWPHCNAPGWKNRGEGIHNVNINTKRCKYIFLFKSWIRCQRWVAQNVEWMKNHYCAEAPRYGRAAKPKSITRIYKQNTE